MWRLIVLGLWANSLWSRSHLAEVLWPPRPTMVGTHWKSQGIPPPFTPIKTYNHHFMPREDVTSQSPQSFWCNYFIPEQCQNIFLCHLPVPSWDFKGLWLSFDAKGSWESWCTGAAGNFWSFTTPISRYCVTSGSSSFSWNSIPIIVPWWIFLVFYHIRTSKSTFHTKHQWSILYMITSHISTSDCQSCYSQLRCMWTTPINKTYHVTWGKNHYEGGSIRKH